MRCKWCDGKNKKYVEYHDKEWGILNTEDKYLFEMLILESFQAGLSWECVLNKREAFRKSYDNFAIDKIINYDDKKIEELINNKDIIRNRFKRAIYCETCSTDKINDSLCLSDFDSL